MDSKDIKNILIVQIGKIGDMILTTPLFIKLKEIFPDSRLTVLASPINKDIPLYHKYVDEVIIYEKNIFSLPGLLLKLRNNKYDLWIDSKKEISKTSIKLVKYAKPNLSAGFNFDSKIYDIDLNEFYQPPCNEHTIYINLAVLKYFGMDIKDNVKPIVFIPEDVSKFVENRIKYILGKIILLNISSGNEIRFWSRENWIMLIDNLKSHNSVIITGIRKDEEIVRSIFSGCKGKNVFYFISRSVLEFAELIKRCDLLISPDTSAVHFASCFDTPIVALFNKVEWNYKRFAPLSTKQKVFISDSPVSMESINVEDVLNGVNALISMQDMQIK